LPRERGNASVQRWSPFFTCTPILRLQFINSVHAVGGVSYWHQIIIVRRFLLPADLRLTFRLLFSNRSNPPIYQLNQLPTTRYGVPLH
jgi:hypothetical protein